MSTDESPMIAPRSGDAISPETWARPTGQPPAGQPAVEQPSIIGYQRDGGVPAEGRVPTATAGREEAGIRIIPVLIFSGPSLALAAFAFACAELLGGLVPGQLASMIPSAADSPANHVRIVAMIHLGMAGVGVALACAALLRCQAMASPPTGNTDRPATTAPGWAGYLAAAAVVICALVAFEAGLLLVLSALAPPGGPS